MPPPRVRPPTPVVEMMPPVVARPNGYVAAFRSPQVAPPATRAVCASGSTRTPRIADRSTTTASSQCRSRDAVAASAHGDGQRVVGREADGGHHVAGVRRRDDDGRALVDHAVANRARLVVPRVIRPDDGSPDPLAQSVQLAFICPLLSLGLSRRGDKGVERASRGAAGAAGLVGPTLDPDTARHHDPDDPFLTGTRQKSDEPARSRARRIRPCRWPSFDHGLQHPHIKQMSALDRAPASPQGLGMRPGRVSSCVPWRLGVPDSSNYGTSGPGRDRCAITRPSTACACGRCSVACDRFGRGADDPVWLDSGGSVSSVRGERKRHRPRPAVPQHRGDGPRRL